MAIPPRFLASTLLSGAGFRHGFFTRAIASRTDAAPELCVPAGSFYYLSQVHGVEARVLPGGEDVDEVARSVGDVTLSRVPGVVCGIRTADCVPILIGDRASGACAAIHSGWRGTVQNVAAAGVAALRELIGSRGDLVAAIGPHIELCCFEVGPDVAADLARASSLGERAIDPRPGDKPHVDLRAIVRAQLLATGIGEHEIDDVRGCTVCDAERFHSYRRDKANSGRLLSAIVASDAGANRN